MEEGLMESAVAMTLPQKAQWHKGRKNNYQKRSVLQIGFSQMRASAFQFNAVVII